MDCSRKSLTFILFLSNAEEVFWDNLTVLHLFLSDSLKAVQQDSVCPGIETNHHELHL